MVRPFGEEAWPKEGWRLPVVNRALEFKRAHVQSSNLAHKSFPGATPSDVVEKGGIKVQPFSLSQ